MKCENLQSKVALVTGGTGDIGRAICQQMVQAGYRVVAGTSEVTSTKTEWSKQVGVALCRFDVSDFEESSAAVKSLVERQGRIDVLVNNAGITRDSSLVKMEQGQWDDVLQTNLSSLFNVTQFALNSMRERGYGRIINISSVNAQKGQFGQCNYAAAKAGMYGFTKSLALETAKKGITVNCISPGYIQTKMLERVPNKIREEIKNSIPVGRFGVPQEIARVVLFLTADESSYITGTNLAVNGGLHMV